MSILYELSNLEDRLSYLKEDLVALEELVRDPWATDWEKDRAIDIIEEIEFEISEVEQQIEGLFFY